MNITKHVHLFLYVQIIWTLAEVIWSHSLLHVGFFHYLGAQVWDVYFFDKHTFKNMSSCCANVKQGRQGNIVWKLKKQEFRVQLHLLTWSHPQLKHPGLRDIICSEYAGAHLLASGKLVTFNDLQLPVACLDIAVTLQWVILHGKVEKKKYLPSGLPSCSGRKQLTVCGCNLAERGGRKLQAIYCNL